MIRDMHDLYLDEEEIVDVEETVFDYISIDDMLSEEIPNAPIKQVINNDMSTIDVIELDDSYIPQEDNEISMWNAFDEFELEAFTNANSIKIKDEQLDNALNGLQEGLHLIAGHSNHGKSALLTELELGILEVNDDVYLLSFTLDDSKQDKMARLAASLNKVTINFIKTPQRLGITNSPNDQMYIKWKNAVNKIKVLSNKLNIIDQGDGTSIEDIENKIIDTLAILKTKELQTGKKIKLVVTIDSFHDLQSNTLKDTKEEAVIPYIANKLRKMATTYHLPIVCTAELRKGDIKARPNLQDVRGAIKLVFNARSVMMVYNEVSHRGEAANVYYNVQGDTKKFPVLECHFAKNKSSAYKGRLFYTFQPEKVTLGAVSVQNAAKFCQKIYG